MLVRLGGKHVPTNPVTWWLLSHVHRLDTQARRAELGIRSHTMNHHEYAYHLGRDN